MILRSVPDIFVSLDPSDFASVSGTLILLTLLSNCVLLFLPHTYVTGVELGLCISGCHIISSHNPTISSIVYFLIIPHR